MQTNGVFSHSFSFVSGFSLGCDSFASASFIWVCLCDVLETQKLLCNMTGKPLSLSTFNDNHFSPAHKKLLLEMGYEAVFPLFSVVPTIVGCVFVFRLSVFLIRNLARFIRLPRRARIFTPSPFIVRNLYFILLNALTAKTTDHNRVPEVWKWLLFSLRNVHAYLCCRYGIVGITAKSDYFRGNLFSMILAMGKKQS